MKVRLRPYADLIEEGGEALLLRGEGGLVHLGPVGAAIVTLAANAIDLDTLAGALERRFGAPEGSSTRAAVDVMVRELAGKGVLDLDPPDLDLPDRHHQPDLGDPHWRISDAAAFTVCAPDRVVVLCLDRPGETPRALLGSGAAIWRGLVGVEDEPRPWVAESVLLDALADAHGTDAASIRGEVLDFLHELASQGLLEARTSP